MQKLALTSVQLHTDLKSAPCRDASLAPTQMSQGIGFCVIGPLQRHECIYIDVHGEVRAIGVTEGVHDIFKCAHWPSPNL